MQSRRFGAMNGMPRQEIGLFVISIVDSAS